MVAVYRFLSSAHIYCKPSKHVSCEFDKFRIDPHLCKLRDASTLANTKEEIHVFNISLLVPWDEV